MLNRMDINRVERAIKFVEKGAFEHVDKPTSDEVTTVLAILYDYRRELTNRERKQHVISQ